MVVSIKNFHMRFGQRVIIQNLSFEVAEGEVFGLLGSNGSGKTTTIRALMGIYQPTSGQLLINGQPFSPSAGQAIGYLPEERGLYKKESVIDTMVYFGQLKGLSRAEARRWSLDYLQRVELADKANQSLERLSGGQQQKIQLGITIMNRPQLLILDEPTKGFDPINRRLMLDLVQQSRSEGSTVILVTHQMEEVERLCQRIILLKDGQARLYGSVEDIRRQYGSDSIDLQFDGQLDTKSTTYQVIESAKNQATIIAKDKHTHQHILQDLAKQTKLQLTSYQVQQASLDDIFVQIYQEEDSHA